MAHRFRLTCVPGLLTFLVFAATDTSGAIVVGTKITVTNPATNETHAILAGENGDFVFPQLGPGFIQAE